MKAILSLRHSIIWKKMTIADIRKAQTTEIGPNRKHLFAIGIFQMIPSTIFGKRKR